MLIVDEHAQRWRLGMVPASWPLIGAKLEPPHRNDDLVPRPGLVARLDEGLRRPLTLVHAPAGYGKSSLVGQWLNRPGAPPATWLWLDEDDNDLSRFIAYTVAAVQRVFPNSCQSTRALLNRPLSTAPERLTSTLLNDLGDLPHRFVFVLEEWETIWRSDIHRFLRELVEHQPETLHLVLVSRSAPPLPLSRLRQRRLLNELGADDLRLTLAEATTVLAKTSTGGVDASAVAARYTQTEGWVGGLHLVTAGGDASTYVDEFFLDDVLARQPQHIQEFLLETSPLERFSPALAANVCHVAPSREAATLLLRSLRDASLFLHGPDGSAGWYRYHRLFREALYRALLSRRGDEAVAALHRRAAGWLETNGEIDAALSHWLAAGAQQAAADLVERQVSQALATEAIPALAAWLERLPSALVRQRPALLLADAWVTQARLLLPATKAHLDATELLLDADGVASPALESATAALRSNHWYWRGNAARSKAAAERARNLVPATEPFTAAFAVAHAALSRQLAGVEDEALHELEAGLRQPRLPPGAKAQLQLGRALIHLRAGRLYEAERSAATLLRLAAGNGLAGSASWAHYLLGRIYYDWNRLEDAAAHYSAVLNGPDAAAGLPLHDSHLGLALIRALRGEHQAVDEMLQNLGDRFWERGALYMPLAGSFRARLALQRGEIATAALLVEQSTSTQNVPSLLPLEIPALTHIRVLVERKTPDNLKAALAALSSLLRVARATHNRLRYVELLALRALVLAAQGEMETALDVLRQALNMAEPGGMIRVFVDLGPAMAALLYRLTPAEPTQAYTGRLLAAFPRSPQPALLTPEQRAAGITDPLTDREWEVLQLLGQRLSNKEIAQRLTISPYTVKKHASNIYRKLDVTNRSEAGARARWLGLLSTPPQKIIP